MWPTWVCWGQLVRPPCQPVACRLTSPTASTSLSQCRDSPGHWPAPVRQRSRNHSKWRTLTKPAQIYIEYKRCCILNISSCKRNTTSTSDSLNLHSDKGSITLDSIQANVISHWYVEARFQLCTCTSGVCGSQVDTRVALAGSRAVLISTSRDKHFKQSRLSEPTAGNNVVTLSIPFIFDFITTQKLSDTTSCRLSLTETTGQA